MQRGLTGIAILTLAPLAACTDQASNPAPPRLKEPLVLKEQASTIRIPVAIPLKELEAAINAEVPQVLERIDEPQQACIKTKSKLLPDISCRLVGTVRRGPIRLTGSGNVLRLSMPVSAVVRAENIGKIIKRETATGAMNVTARVTLGLSRDWRPHAKVAADYNWTNKIGIDFLGRRITFASKVDPKLRQILSGLERTLPRHLDKVQARSQVQRIWAKGFTSVRVKTEPQIWARFTPERVGFSGYSEGWALYTEQLADEMGMYEGDPLGKVGYLQSLLFRATRLVVDSGMHAKRWSREKATDYFIATTGIARGRSQGEIDRYTVWPGQACSYKIGHTVWVRLRDEAKAKAGANWDPRQFHEVLRKGAMPLAVLDRVVRGRMA